MKGIVLSTILNRNPNCKRYSSLSFIPSSSINGNAQLNHTIMLENIIAETYYYSVLLISHNI